MTQFSASIRNQRGVHEVSLKAGDTPHALAISPRADGFASSVSGGELLFLALATCYCNDIYREAARRGIRVERVEVDVSGDFEREGGAGTNITYRARIKADAGREAILDLMRHTDGVAEIQNTLRAASPVELVDCDVIE